MTGLPRQLSDAVGRLPERASRLLHHLPPSASRALDTVLDRTVAPGYSALGVALREHLPGWPADPPAGALAGRSVVVTGASSGLGTSAAVGVVDLGAHVHAVVRDEDKGAKELQKAGIADRATIWRCDMSDLQDVRRLAGELAEHTAQHDPIAAVIHNAGAMPPERSVTDAGYELSMALHVLGPVLLTDLLRPALHDARVVFVTSGGMYAQRLRLDDLQYREQPYRPARAYARSKRAQVELLPALAERWGRDGIVVAAMHPGWVDTPGIGESLPGFRRLTRPILRDEDDGADTSVWLAGAPDTPETGLLWHDRRPRPTTWLGRNATTPRDRAALWRWVRTELDLPVD